MGDVVDHPRRRRNEPAAPPSLDLAIDRMRATLDALAASPTLAETARALEPGQVHAFHVGLGLSQDADICTIALAARPFQHDNAWRLAFLRGRALRRRLRRARTDVALPHAFAVRWCPPRGGAAYGAFLALATIGSWGLVAIAAWLVALGLGLWP